MYIIYRNIVFKMLMLHNRKMNYELQWICKVRGSHNCSHKDFHLLLHKVNGRFVGTCHEHL
jgi:hypothetical protein